MLESWVPNMPCDFGHVTSTLLGKCGHHWALCWEQCDAALVAVSILDPTGTKILEIKEWYQNREDTLELKHINNSTGLHTDYFRPGHPQALRGTWSWDPGGGVTRALEWPP